MIVIFEIVAITIKRLYDSFSNVRLIWANGNFGEHTPSERCIEHRKPIGIISFRLRTHNTELGQHFKERLEARSCVMNIIARRIGMYLRFVRNFRRLPVLCFIAGNSFACRFPWRGQASDIGKVLTIWSEFWMKYRPWIALCTISKLHFVSS